MQTGIKENEAGTHPHRPSGDGRSRDRSDGEKVGQGSIYLSVKDVPEKARRHLESSLECEIPEEVFAKLEDEIENVNG